MQPMAVLSPHMKCRRNKNKMKQKTNRKKRGVWNMTKHAYKICLKHPYIVFQIILLLTLFPFITSNGDRFANTFSVITGTYLCFFTVFFIVITSAYIVGDNK
jgi:heme/copper-type cytochrome/quinol oxidase subunit 4